ncbi:MAG: TolC family protein [Methylophilaceae bacterium]|nr:MAG: TolC family protein [Methylophilaceae bacterium]
MLQAVSNNPQIVNKRNALVSAGYLLDSAEWGRFPSFSTDINTLETGGSNTTIRIEQPLWTGGRITGQIGLAEATLEAARASLGDTEQKILLETATAYFDVLRFEAKLKIALQNEIEHLRLVESMSRRVESEISPKADLIQAETRLRQTTAERIQLENQVAVSRITLEQLTGFRVEEIERPSRFNTEIGTITEILETAIAFSPERARLVFEATIAEEEIKLNRSQAMPNVVLGYQRRMGTVFFTPDNNQLYLGLRLAPGAGLSSLSNINAAKATKDAALNVIESFDRRVAKEVQSVWSERNALLSQAKQVRASVMGADEVIESYLRQFQVGKKNWLEVLNAQREKAVAYYAYTDVEYPLELMSIHLLILTGQLQAKQLDMSKFFSRDVPIEQEQKKFDFNIIMNQSTIPSVNNATFSSKTKKNIEKKPWLEVFKPTLTRKLLNVK